MGNWSSTMAQQDAERTRLVLLTVGSIFGVGLFLLAVGVIYSQNQKVKREEALQVQEHRRALRELKLASPPPPHPPCADDSSAFYLISAHPQGVGGGGVAQSPLEFTPIEVRQY